MKILFVENHEAFARTVVELFLAGHDVTHVTTVGAARGALGAAFDAALVDYDLPDGKGTEVVRALHAARFAGPVVAVSSRDEGNDELRSAGATATCRKADFRTIAAVLAGAAGGR
jgi:DNA-binding response OmpR family regulator